MEYGGLPEMYDDFSLEYLGQMLDLSFFRDIVEMFIVKRSDILKGIFRIIVKKTGQKINFSKLSGDLGTEYRTVSSYIRYIEDSFLIARSLPYEKSSVKSLRKNPKMNHPQMPTYVPMHQQMQQNEVGTRATPGLGAGEPERCCATEWAP